MTVSQSPEVNFRFFLFLFSEKKSHFNLPKLTHVARVVVVMSDVVVEVFFVVVIIYCRAGAVIGL